ncbi:hypothetical protein ACGFIW_02725 [Micromonospora sp. NPDC048935]|uniref:hypothetical protein n=1 Tax=Micromonospora sp. NPDC048935 TaxID=3364262 RepID=UPI0037154015
MDVDSAKVRAGDPTTASGRRRKFLGRASGLQLMAVYWMPMTLLIGLPVGWLFDREKSLVEAVLDAALGVVWAVPSIYLSQRMVGEAGARRDPEGYALRQALRGGTVPADDRVRAELPGYLAGQRRGTWVALPAVLVMCVGLILLALLGADREGSAVILSVIAAVSVAVAAHTLIRVRRLAPLLTTPKPRE